MQSVQTYISTTANGDGLEFDTRLPNIFDEIISIKSEKTFIENLKPRVTLEDNEGLTLDHVAQ